jgi:hypothetical protein
MSKKKAKMTQDYDHDWLRGWLNAAYSSTARTLGLLPERWTPGAEAVLEGEISQNIADILLIGNYEKCEIEGAILPPSEGHSNWRFIAVVKLNKIPFTCMVSAKSPAGLIDAASAWANHVVARKTQLTKKQKEKADVD